MTRDNEITRLEYMFIRTHDTTLTLAHVFFSCFSSFSSLFKRNGCESVFELRIELRYFVHVFLLSLFHVGAGAFCQCACFFRSKLNMHSLSK